MNGKEISVMVDTGATHNFVVDQTVDALGLQVKGYPSNIKAVNSMGQQVHGMAYYIQIQLGDWAGRCSLMIVPLGDFDVIQEMISS